MVVVAYLRKHLVRLKDLKNSHKHKTAKVEEVLRLSMDETCSDAPTLVIYIHSSWVFNDIAHGHSSWMIPRDTTHLESLPSPFGSY